MTYVCPEAIHSMLSSLLPFLCSKTKGGVDAFMKYCAIFIVCLIFLPLNTKRVDEIQKNLTLLLSLN